MLDSIKILQKKYTKDNSSSERLQRNKTRADLEKMLEEQLVDPSDTYEFQVTRASMLNDVIAVIDEPPLSDKYLIVQSSETMSIFIAKTKEVNVWG